MICDRQTDGCPGKNNMSPGPEGGRHNEQLIYTICLSVIDEQLIYTVCFVSVLYRSR